MNDAAAIRELRKVELPEFIELEARCFGPRAWGANKIEAGFADKNTGFTVCVDDQGILAGFLIFCFAPPEAEIYSIGVDPSARKKSIASKLLHELRRRAAAGGIGRIFLEVDKENEAALALYKSAGFIESGERKRYYADGADALVMTLEIV